MEPLPRESVLGGDFLVCFLISIDFVPDNRVTDGGHMNTDLMGSACEELDFEERIFVVDVMEECELGLRELRIDWILGRHALSIMGIASDEGLDHPFLVLYQTVYEGVVELLDLPVCHLLLELFHGTIILGYQDESARVLVETMDDTWALHAVDHRELAEVMQESIYESPRIPEFAWNGVGIDSRIFTDNRKILVVEDDFQIHVLSHEMGFLGLELYLEDISFLDAFIAIQYFPVDLQPPFFYEFLHVGPRVVRKKGR